MRSDTMPDWSQTHPCDGDETFGREDIARKLYFRCHYQIGTPKLALSKKQVADTLHRTPESGESGTTPSTAPESKVSVVLDSGAFHLAGF